MPKKPEGVYRGQGGGWYFKVDRRPGPDDGPARAGHPAGFPHRHRGRKARRELLDQGRPRAAEAAAPVASPSTSCSTCTSTGSTPTGASRPRPDSTTATTADDYVRPHLGHTTGPGRHSRGDPDVAAQTHQEGGTSGSDEDGKLQPGKGLSPNTVRLARAPLAGAFKLAMGRDVSAINPVRPGTPAPSDAVDPQALEPRAGPRVPWLDGG